MGFQGKLWMTRASRLRSSAWKVSSKRPGKSLSLCICYSINSYYLLYLHWLAFPGYNASDSDSDELIVDSWLQWYGYLCLIKLEVSWIPWCRFCLWSIFHCFMILLFILFLGVISTFYCCINYDLFAPTSMFFFLSKKRRSKSPFTYFYVHLFYIFTLGFYKECILLSRF